MILCENTFTAPPCFNGHKIDYVQFFLEIVNPEGHLNCFIGSKVTSILVNMRILPGGGVASGRVCVFSLHSRLVCDELNSPLCLFKRYLQSSFLETKKKFWLLNTKLQQLMLVETVVGY